MSTFQNCCRSVLFALPAILISCSEHSEPSVLEIPPKPMRVVSLDYCADQFVMQFLDESQVLALSPDAVKDFSYLNKMASKFSSVSPRAENVLVLQPDLVVRSYGGGPTITKFLTEAGIPTLQVGWVNQLSGDEVGSVSWLIKDVADKLGESNQGAQLAAQYQRRLVEAELESGIPEITALYITPSGYTTGPGALVSQMMEHVGLENFESEPGWRALPLERLVHESPGVVIAGFFDSSLENLAYWSASRHPVASRQLEKSNTVRLSGAAMTCGGWFLADAVEALRNANPVSE